MKPFRFRLERLMHVKEAERRQRVSELVERQRILDETKERLQAAQRRQDEVHTMYVSLAEGESTAAQWLNAERALVRQVQVVGERVGETQAASEETEVARQALIEKSREFETLDRLRNRQFEEHRLEERRRDSKENDARAVERYLQATRSDSDVSESR